MTSTRPTQVTMRGTCGEIDMVTRELTEGWDDLREYVHELEVRAKKEPDKAAEKEDANKSREQ